ncbi:MAG: aldehyde dehydrogenase family protein [Thermodesulfobacteriota bacterium]
MAKDCFSSFPKILVGGEWLKTGKELQVLSPYDGEVVGTTCLGGEEELDRALASADAAFETLKKLPAYKRAEIIGRVVDGLKERREDLARTIALEAGKPITDARVEAARAANTFQVALEETKRLGGELIPLDIIPGAEGRVGLVKRCPVGSVLGISPFNFPLNLVAHKVAPAMAVGCPIIIKPATKTPLSALLLGEIVAGAGWPEGAISVVPSPGPLVEKLLGDERVKKLTFTGSAEVGWRLKEKAARIKVTLELGGNAGVIVHEDADLEFAAKRCTVGAFSYAGQVCISVQRIYVHRKVFSEFKDKFVANIKTLKLGDPMDETTEVGPMIDEGSLKRTGEWVKEALDGGAELLTGGKRWGKGKEKGKIFEPTVLTGTTPEMKVSCEELFAPVTTLEPFDDFEAALREVNRSRYGLQAGVFTSDTKKIFRAFDTLEVGGVVAGDIPTFRTDNMPYGGVKESGFGREGVRYAMEEMTEMRLLALNLS